MKANELMIGDYVKVNKDVCIKKDTIVEIRGIDADNAFLEKRLKGCATCMSINDHTEYGGVWVKYLSPIPLTPEILEKNGFEWHDNEAKYFPNAWCRGELMLEPIVDGSMFLIVSRNDYDDESTNYTPFTIKNVHELQHALRLCRSEKEIEL